MFIFIPKDPKIRCLLFQEAVFEKPLPYIWTNMVASQTILTNSPYLLILPGLYTLNFGSLSMGIMHVSMTAIFVGCKLIRTCKGNIHKQAEF
jgi:hypothetical protein